MNKSLDGQTTLWLLGAALSAVQAVTPVKAADSVTSNGVDTTSDTTVRATSSACPANAVVKTIAASMGSNTPAEAATDDLSRSNNAFRASYAEAKRQILEKLGPVIIVMGDRAVLLKSGIGTPTEKRAEAQLIPAEYTLAKTVDHVALAVFVTLTNKTDAPLDAASRHHLEELRDLALKAVPEIEKAGLSVNELSRQHQIIDQSLSFIKETLAAGQVSSSTLQKFTRSMAKLTLLNVDDAIGEALGRLDQVVQGWRKEISAADWNNLCVVVVSGHMPRIQNSQMQYFQKLLRQKQEGDRLIYLEGTADEKQALDLLVTHKLDRRIAIDFYKDPWRMHRDLLSDGAHKYLKKHPPSNK